DLQTARTRYDQLVVLNQQCLVARSDAQAAKLAFEQRCQAAKETYARHLRLARMKPKRAPIAQAKLLLDGSRAQDLAGWINQAQSFYSNALSDPALRQTLTQGGIDLEAGQAQILLIEQAQRRRLAAESAAYRATAARDAALVALRDWVRDLVVVARVAL